MSWFVRKWRRNDLDAALSQSQRPLPRTERLNEQAQPASADGVRDYTSEGDVMEDEFGNHAGGDTGETASEIWDSSGAG